MSKKVKQVAVLLGAGGDWGRKAIEGIMAYEHEAGPWYLKLNPLGPQTFSEIPAEWEDSDGFIAAVFTPELAEKLNNLGKPVVNLADSSIQNFSAPNLRTDDRIGTRLAVEHFLERGFRSLAFAGPSIYANAVEYEEHFHSALENEGIQPCPSFSYNGTDVEMLDPLQKWLQELPKPAGILAWGHGYAQAIVDGCMLGDISVPHDIAILSASNDDFMCNACHPPLSGVLSPMKQIGYTAAKLLDQMMDGKKVKPDISYFAPAGVEGRLSTDALAVTDSQLRKVVAFMKENAHDSITVEDVLAAVPMARSSLELRFQKAFGRTPAEEIRRFRINKARRLLADTDMSMQEVAEACGFSSYNYLSYSFKKIAGMPPLKYRKSMRVK